MTDKTLVEKLTVEKLEPYSNYDDDYAIVVDSKFLKSVIAVLKEHESQAAKDTRQPIAGYQTSDGQCVVTRYKDRESQAKVSEVESLKRQLCAALETLNTLLPVGAPRFSTQHLWSEERYKTEATRQRNAIERQELFQAANVKYEE